MWKPKEQCGAAKEPYRTKIELGKELLVFVRKRRLNFSYVCFDGWYAAGWFMRWQKKRGIVAVTQFPCDRHVVYMGKKQRVDWLAEQLRYRREQEGEGEYAVAKVQLPDYGLIRLVVTNRRREPKKVQVAIASL